jgi:hypothetical protein
MENETAKWGTAKEKELLAHPFPLFPLSPDKVFKFFSRCSYSFASRYTCRHWEQNPVRKDAVKVRLMRNRMDRGSR